MTRQDVQTHTWGTTRTTVTTALATATLTALLTTTPAQADDVQRDERLAVPTSRSQVEVPVLDPGRYVFRVEALSRAGASPWARSLAVYVE